MSPRPTLDLRSSCLSLWRVGIAGMCHHVQLTDLMPNSNGDGESLHLKVTLALSNDNCIHLLQNKACKDVKLGFKAA